MKKTLFTIFSFLAFAHLSQAYMMKAAISNVIQKDEMAIIYFWFPSKSHPLWQHVQVAKVTSQCSFEIGDIVVFESSSFFKIDGPENKHADFKIVNQSKPCTTYGKVESSFTAYADDD